MEGTDINRLKVIVKCRVQTMRFMYVEVVSFPPLPPTFNDISKGEVTDKSLGPCKLYFSPPCEIRELSITYILKRLSSVSGGKVSRSILFST